MLKDLQDTGGFAIVMFPLSYAMPPRSVGVGAVVGRGCRVSACVLSSACLLLPHHSEPRWIL